MLVAAKVSAASAVTSSEACCQATERCGATLYSAPLHGLAGPQAYRRVARRLVCSGAVLGREARPCHGNR